MSRTSRIIIAASPFIAGLLALPFVGAIEQDPTYHRFADDRAWLGIPNFGDVASNLPFVIAGVAGLALLPRLRLRDRRERWMWGLFFAAQALTGLGSAWYHAAPNDARLVWDRLPLAVVLMSLAAIVIAERVGIRAGWRSLGPLLALGAGSIALWGFGGDLRLYAVVQFGTILSLPLALVLLPPSYSGGWGYAGAIALYAAAKACEALDRPIFSALGGAASGHTIKHLLAGAAAVLLVGMAARRSPRDQEDNHGRAAERVDRAAPANAPDPANPA